MIGRPVRGYYAKIGAMTLSTGLTIGALLIAGASLFFAARSANAARSQTAIQRQLREDGAQPYVWVDLRPSPEHAQLILLVVGNSGPTVATNVRVTLTPPLTSEKTQRADKVNAALDRGISALAPQRQMAWSLGTPWNFIDSAPDKNQIRVDISASGPFGELEPINYTLDMETLRFTLAVPDGTLHGVAGAIKDLTKAIRPSQSDRRVGEA